MSTACEHCEFETMPEWARKWRVWCHGCGVLHMLCADCGLAFGTPRVPTPVWAEMDACPDQVRVAQELAGAVREGGRAVAQRALEEGRWEPLDEVNGARAVQMASEKGLPVKRYLLPHGLRTDYGLLLRDGREVWLMGGDEPLSNGTQQ